MASQFEAVQPARRRPTAAVATSLVILLFGVSVAAPAETISFEAVLEFAATASATAALGDLSLEQARRAYEGDRAILYPTIDLSAPISYGTTLLDRYSTQVGPTTIDVEHRGGYSIGLSPTLSLLQALPTGGTLSASIGDTLSFTDPGTFDPESIADSLPIDERPNHTLTVGLGFDQPLYFGGSAFSAALETAENSWTRSILTHESSRNQVRLDAAQRYFRLQYLGYSLEMVAARDDAAQDRLETMEREAELGTITESALLQARLAARRSELDLLDAERARDQAWSEFCAIYAIPDGMTVGARVETIVLPEIDPGSLVQDGVANNPDLQMLRLARQDAANALIVFDSGRAPRLSFGLDFTYTDLSEEDEPDRSTGLRGSLSVSANLFDGGADRNRREELTLQSSQAQLETDRAADNLRRQIDGLLGDLDRSDVYRDYLIAARDVAEYELDRGVRNHELGVITDRQLEDLELELESTRLELARATVDANMTRLNLLLALGRPVSDATTILEDPDQ